MKTYGEKLRDLRGVKSRSEVARACGISVSALTMYELNARRPRDEIKERLAAYYKTPLTWIFFCLIMPRNEAKAKGGSHDMERQGQRPSVIGAT